VTESNLHSTSFRNHRAIACLKFSSVNFIEDAVMSTMVAMCVPVGLGSKCQNMKINLKGKDFSA
jgi:hypothetical protein